MNNNFEAVAREFVEYYYKAFDADRNSLCGLYRDNSMLTFESQSFLGVSSIIQKLTTLSFKKVTHQISTLDAQPSNSEGGIFIMVTGQLIVDEETHPMSFTQTFQLLRDSDGQYYVSNDFFKLILG